MGHYSGLAGSVALALIMLPIIARRFLQGCVFLRVFVLEPSLIVKADIKLEL